MSKLKAFLHDRRTTDGNVTHTGMDEIYMGSYTILDHDIPDFFRLYSEAMENEAPLSITEKHKSFSPVLIDLDMIFDRDTGSERKITPQNIKTLLNIYNCVYDTFFSDSIPDSMKDAYVLVKPSLVPHNGNIKDGIHIIFPKMVIDTKIQLDIRKHALRALDESKMFENIGCKNSLHDIVDESVCQRNNWLMYGSSKDPPNNVYELKYKYVCNKGAYSMSDIETDIDWVQYFSIRNHANEIKYELSEDISYEVIDSIEFRQSNKTSESELAKILLKIVSPLRAESYSEWLDIGFCLHNIDNGLLGNWIEFSKQSSKYKAGECEKLWTNMKDEGLTIGSLYRWARIDNKQEFMQFMNEHKSNDIESTILDATETDVANLLYSQYQYDFICANIKDNQWLQFKNHRWVPMQSAVWVNKTLTTDINTQYSVYGMRLKNKCIDADSSKKAKYENLFKQCEKLRRFVKKPSFIEGVIKQAKVPFYFERFEELADSNPHLIAFDNGVYDFSKCIFRDGRPTDYITYSTHIEYVEYDSHNPYIKEVEAFISKIFTNYDLKEYVMKQVASFLNGANDNQDFNIWTGTGANGKTTFVEFLAHALGDYSCSLPVAMITQKRQSADKANPSMKNTKGKRFAHMQEPENDDEINAGLMKEITGKDTISVRGLYEGKMVEFKPQFSLVLCCNDKPKVKSNDYGTWRRMRVVPYKSKFIDNPSKDNPNEFKKDSRVVANITKKEWREALISILVKYYKKWKVEGNPLPVIVQEAIKEYEKSSNIFLEFFDEYLDVIPENKSNETVGLTSLFSEFKEWYKDAYCKKPPTRNELKKELIKEFGEPCVSSGWKCLRIRSQT